MKTDDTKEHCMLNHTCICKGPRGCTRCIIIDKSNPNLKAAQPTKFSHKQLMHYPGHNFPEDKI